MTSGGTSLTPTHEAINCLESQKLQVSWCTHDEGPLLDSQHHLPSQEGPAVPPLPTDVEEMLKLPPLILTTFHRVTIENALTSCLTVWYGNCTASDHKTLQLIVSTAEKKVEVFLTTIDTSYNNCCICKASSIVDNPSNDSHGLFTFLPCGRRCRNIPTTTNRLHNSFFPQAVRLINSLHPNAHLGYSNT